MKNKIEYYISFCPFCVKETKCFLVKHREKIEILNILYEITCDLLKCSECKGKFHDGKICLDPIDVAIRQYRKEKNWIQSEEIIALRRSFKFTQKEFAKEININYFIFCRMEDGYIQNKEFEEKLKTFFIETI